MAGSNFPGFLFHSRALGLGVLLCALASTRCAPGGPQSIPAPKRERLDALTSFTLLISKRDFVAAAKMLSPGDRGRMAGGNGEILPEYRDRLRAMRLTTLLNDPRIRIERGAVDGLFEVLPVLDEGNPGVAPWFPETTSVAGGDTLAPMAASPRPDGDEKLRKAATAFFKSVRAKDWPRAMGLVNENEREVFLKGAGKLKAGAANRLSAIDTSSWTALTLKDGKLTGIVLLVMPAED